MKLIPDTKSMRHPAWLLCVAMMSLSTPHCVSAAPLVWGSGNWGDIWQGMDTDGDGVMDSIDAFPLDITEWLDTDSDSVGNNADWDDDGDGVPDGIDADPLNNANAVEIKLPLDGTNKGAHMSNGVLAQ